MRNLDAFDGYLTRHYSQDGDAAQYGRSRIAYVRHNYGAMLPSDRAAVILDIGPGYGELMQWLSATLGYQHVHGIDLSKEVVEACNRIMPGCATAVTDTRAYLEERRRYYDCIFMIHVLEHVPKPDVLPLLRAVRESLKHGGLLILEVPNMANPITGLRTRYDDFTHECGYTEMSLRHVLSLSGFERVDVRGIAIPRDSFMRHFQAAAQNLLQFLLRLGNRVYGSRRKTSFAASIFGVGRVE
jgi:2-polyprenyl-3-methyl-5-hydroxy-6-metoxy-1,4-benzoquinol methylase